MEKKENEEALTAMKAKMAFTDIASDYFGKQIMNSKPVRDYNKSEGGKNFVEITNLSFGNAISAAEQTTDSAIEKSKNVIKDIFKRLIMKSTFYFLLLLFVPAFISAQTTKTKAPDFIKLDAKDPLIGEWEWVKDPTGSPFSPSPGIDFTYIRFSPKDSLSVGALESSEWKGWLGSCYFLVYANGTTARGVLSGCSNPVNNGKLITIHYEVTGNELVITSKGEKIYYRRK